MFALSLYVYRRESHFSGHKFGNVHSRRLGLSVLCLEVNHCYLHVLSLF